MKTYFIDCNTEPQVKREYRKLAHKYHPDKNRTPEAKEIFQEIEKQKTAALRRIAVSEGKEAGYYEQLIIGKTSFMEMINNLDKDLENENVDINDFGSLFQAVGKKLFGTAEKKDIPKKSDPGILPEGKG